MPLAHVAVVEPTEAGVGAHPHVGQRQREARGPAGTEPRGSPQAERRSVARSGLVLAPRVTGPHLPDGGLRHAVLRGERTLRA